MGGVDEGGMWRKYRIFAGLAEEFAKRKPETDIDQFTPKDLEEIALGAMLAGNSFLGKCGASREPIEIECRKIQKVMGFCLTHGKEMHAAAIASGITTCPGIEDRAGDERIAIAVKVLLGYSSRSGEGRKKLFALLWHDDPSVQMAVIKNLAVSQDLEVLEKTVLNMSCANCEVRRAALEYVEILLCEIAFRGKENDMLGPGVMNFLRDSLRLFEEIQPAVEARGDNEVSKRLKIIITLTYNHVLRDMYREAETNETREISFYMSIFEQFTEIADSAIGLLAKRLIKTPQNLGMDSRVDENIKICCIDALAKIGEREEYRKRVVPILRAYAGKDDQPQKLKYLAKSSVDYLEGGNKRYSLPPKPPPVRLSLLPGNPANPGLKRAT